MNLALLIAGGAAIILASKKRDGKRAIDWFSVKFKHRNRYANAYIDHLIREHKKALRISNGIERTVLDKLIDKVKDREANGWENELL